MLKEPILIPYQDTPKESDLVDWQYDPHHNEGNPTSEIVNSVSHRPGYYPQSQPGFEEYPYTNAGQTTLTFATDGLGGINVNPIEMAIEETLLPVESHLNATIRALTTMVNLENPPIQPLVTTVYESPHHAHTATPTKGSTVTEEEKVRFRHAQIGLDYPEHQVHHVLSISETIGYDGISF